MKKKSERLSALNNTDYAKILHVERKNRRKDPKKRPPRLAIWWNWFKTHYLCNETTFSSSSSAPLSFAEFQKFVKKNTPLNYWPIEVRRNSKTAKKIRKEFLRELFIFYQYTLSPKLSFHLRHSDYGLGIFARKSIINRNELWGLLLHVNDWVGKELKEVNYFSLCPSSSSSSYIMIGPLSLVNHSCNARFSFTAPQKNHLKELDDWFLGFNAIYLSCEQDFIPVKKRQEIFALYNKTELNFECKCTAVKHVNLKDKE